MPTEKRRQLLRERIIRARKTIVEATVFGASDEEDWGLMLINEAVSRLRMVEKLWNDEFTSAELTRLQCDIGARGEDPPDAFLREKVREQQTARKELKGAG